MWKPLPANLCPGRRIKKFPKLLFYVQAVLGIALDFFPDPGETISAVWRKVLGDSDLGSKIRFHSNDLLGGFSTVQFAKKGGGAFRDGGVGVCLKKTGAVFKLGKYPKLGNTPFDQKGFYFIFIFQSGGVFRPVDHIGKAFERIFKGHEFLNQLIPFLLNTHRN